MFGRIRAKGSPALAVSIAAVVLAASGSAVAASGLITSKDVKNGSLTGRDVKNNSLGLADISSRAEKALAGQDGAKGDSGAAGAKGATGAAGPRGAAGAKGDQGAAGAKGDQGAAGAKGDQGAAGADAVSYVTSLGGDWLGYERNADCDDDQDTGNALDTATLNGHLVLGEFPDGSAASGASFDPPAGLTLGQLDALSYSERATGGLDGLNAPYVKLVTQGGNSVTFSPNTQAGGPGSTADWRRHNIVRGTVRYNDDAGNNPEVSWSDVSTAHGAEVVAEIRVQAGCAGSGSDGSTAYVDDVTIVAGDYARHYDFE